MDWLDALAEISQVLTVVSIVLAALSIRASNETSRRQWNVDIFTTYSKRHEEILDSFPEDSYYYRFDSEKLAPSSLALTQAVLKYLTLMSELRYLSHERYLDHKIWQIWESEIKRTLKSPLFMREWQTLKAEFVADSQFRAFVDTIQSELDPHSSK